MNKYATYNCEKINGQRLFIPDLQSYLCAERTDIHFIKGTVVCFCRRGSATIRVNYSTFNMKENDVLAILPTHMFCVENVSDNLEMQALLYSDEYWASISHSLDYRVLKNVEYSPHFTLQKEHCDEVYYLLDLVRKHEVAEESLLQHSDIERSVAGGLAFSLLMILVSFLNTAYSISSHLSNRKEEITHEFFELLANHYETERTVAFYADKLCITPKHLSTTVKEVTHFSIQEWINNVTVLHIKRCLLTTTKTIAEISDDLNFQTPSTFIRYFRQHTGITPSKFRNSVQF